MLLCILVIRLYFNANYKQVVVDDFKCMTDNIYIFQGILYSSTHPTRE